MEMVGWSHMREVIGWKWYGGNRVLVVVVVVAGRLVASDTTFSVKEEGL